MVRVVVADDHPAPRAGIVQAISRDPSIQVVGEASNGPEVWDLLAKGGFDVLLLDLNMPGFDPDYEVPNMQTRYPGVKVLVVTADDTEESVCSLVEARVAGYLLKDEDMDRYIEAIHDVAQGRPFFSKRILSVALDGGTSLPTLTQREKQVLKLVARGDTSEQVAKTLIISERTVNFHVANILHKLNVDSRAAAAAKASEMGLISAWRDQ
jgi:DNA-binding NarL/FixJ family response regulator